MSARCWRRRTMNHNRDQVSINKEFANQRYVRQVAGTHQPILKAGNVVPRRVPQWGKRVHARGAENTLPARPSASSSRINVQYREQMNRMVQARQYAPERCRYAAPIHSSVIPPL